MTASERAAGELVADVDELAGAIRRALDVGGFLVTPRELAEALVAAGFGNIAAARREALLSAANALGNGPTMRRLVERESCDWWTDAPVAGWLRDRAHQIGATS